MRGRGESSIASSARFTAKERVLASGPGITSQKKLTADEYVSERVRPKHPSVQDFAVLSDCKRKSSISHSNQRFVGFETAGS